MSTVAPPRPAAPRPGAFTLVELLVVIIIITIVAAIAIPAFSSMVYSSESAMASTKLTTALRAARDAALRSTGDADAALVFFYESGGRTTIVPCVKVGQLEDVSASNSSLSIFRDVFVPVNFIEPIQLPRNWMIRGYAPPGSVDDGTVGTAGTPREGWYDAGPTGTLRYGNNASDGDWVFPETGFYYGADPNNSNALTSEPLVNQSGRDRQTFMVRFQAGTGIMLTADADPALVVAPRPTGRGRTQAPFGGFRIDRAKDLRRFVRRVLSDPMMEDEEAGNNPPIPPGQRLSFRRQLLGDQATDTVLARPVGQIALYDENALISSLASAPGLDGIRLDPATGCLYANVDHPQFVTAGAATPSLISQRVNQWIRGDTNFNGTAGDRQVAGGQAASARDEPQAQIYTVDRYTGQVRRVEVEP